MKASTLEPWALDEGQVLGNDPDCGFARQAPGLHACTTRDGDPVTAGKACFAWARHSLLAEVPKCQACGRAIYQNTERSASPSGRYSSEGLYLVADPTWRHLDDGTVAVMPDRALSCMAVAS